MNTEKIKHIAILQILDEKHISLIRFSDLFSAYIFIYTGWKGVLIVDNVALIIVLKLLAIAICPIPITDKNKFDTSRSNPEFKVLPKEFNEFHIPLKNRSFK